MKIFSDSLGVGTRYVIDGLSFSVALATIVGAIPAIAGIFSLIYTAIQIYESRTFQRRVVQRGRASMQRRRTRRRIRGGDDAAG